MSLMKAIAKDRFQTEYRNLINNQLPQSDNLSYVAFRMHVRTTSDYFKTNNLSDDKQLKELYALYKECMPK